MNFLITGGSGGIGHQFVQQLAARPDTGRVFATHHTHAAPHSGAKVSWQQLDLEDEAAIAALAADLPPLHGVINAAGLLHRNSQLPEKSIRKLEPEWFLENIRTNTLPSLLLAKHLHQNLRHNERAVFATVSARVGSIEENALGGWYSYRAAKAALNMSLKNLSIEWRRTLPNVIVAALHPGTTDTELSRPFQSRVAPDKLFTARRSVTQMLEVLESLSPADSGGFWSWDGTALPW